MRRGVLSRPVFGGVVLAVACASGGVVLGITAAAKAGEPSAALTDTEPPASTEPTPDPAPPPPQPRPKPLVKPKAAPVYHPPVHHAPVRHRVHSVRTTHTRSYAPSHRKRYARRHAKRKPVAHHARHRRSRIASRAKPIAVKAVAAPAKPLLPRIRVAIPAGAATPGEQGSAERAFVIAGLAAAALLFLVVVALPSTAARFTATGRVLMDHQVDLVFAGVGALLLTALLLAITGLVS